MDPRIILAREKEHGDDREWLKKQQRDIRNKVSKCLTANGFKKSKRSLFIRMEEDLIAFFALEHPPGHMYINFAIYPLFMPPILDCVTLSIGNRLEASMNDSDMVISDYYTMEEVVVCCEKLTSFIQDHVDPLIQKVNTTQKLISFLLSYRYDFRNIIRISTLHSLDVLIYAYLSLHQYDAVRQYAGKYCSLIDAPGNKGVKALHMKRYQEVMKLAQTEHDLYVDDEVAKWKAQVLSLFLGNHK